jgi:hypothetical protein
MTVPTDDLDDPTVRVFVTAINAGDREAFFALLAPGATMTDDGTERDLTEWVDREIFSSSGHMDVESQSDDGRSLVALYSNSTWGAMRTTWRFTIDGDQVVRFETGQAR